MTLITWATKSSMPTARYQLTACLLDSNIFAIGGWQSSIVGPIYNKVEIYNPESDKWYTETPMPVARAIHASIVLDGKIYVYGGSRTNHPLIGTSAIYEFSYGNIFSQQPCVDKPYARKNIDSVLFRTRFSNIFNHQFTPYLIIANTDSTQIDSLTLYDDGLHGDSLSNDGLYGGFIPPRQAENYFILSISTIEKLTNKYFNTPDLCRFTTAGPVTLDSISVNTQYDGYAGRIYLHNNGSTESIANGTVKLICNDPWISYVLYGQSSFPTLPPGTSTGSGMTLFGVIDSLFHGYCNFKVEVSIDGWTYWNYSIKVFFHSTGVDDEIVVPSTFRLEQNFPNPFNSSSVIKYSIPKLSQVSLKIFNTLGGELETLVNEEKPAGTYELTWNAANLPSGVYFYRIQAGSFIATKKMLLLK